MTQDDIRFHSERAEIERERARRAASVMAARAHLQLSELHQQRLSSLASGASALASRS